jgi:hypothetical protein
LPAQEWELVGFMNALREWMRRDPPPGELLARAAEFGSALERNPEADAEQQGHPSLFLRRMPGTEHEDRIVAITFELTRPKPRGTGQVICQDVFCMEYPREALFEIHPAIPHHRTVTRRSSRDST